MPQSGNQWTAEDPRPQEYVGHGHAGLEQDLQGGLDASRR
jgi:mitogen-activated protein kinase 7